jgi:cation diffusion facilitator family transporter
MLDSVVDLLSQFVLSIAQRFMDVHNDKYPVGRSKLEALSVLGCAAIMAVTSVEVIQFSIADLIEGFSGNKPVIEVGVILYTILGVGIFLKVILYIYCIVASKAEASDILDALAEDHLNDVFSNVAAVITAAVAFNFKFLWWTDPAGAIIISAVIVFRWVYLIMDQIKKFIGYTAPEEFINQVNELAKSHDERIILDCTRAYHFGPRYNVEMEIVLPADMTVRESHDIALALQHKIEEFEEVERAFVHVDHMTRDGLEHKIERTLVTKRKLLDDQKSSGSDDYGYARVGIRMRSIAGTADQQANI